jgi:hypothetical protein
MAWNAQRRADPFVRLASYTAGHELQDNSSVNRREPGGPKEAGAQMNSAHSGSEQDLQVFSRTQVVEFVR